MELTLGPACSFALAMVNIAGSRLILNLKAYAAARQRDSDLTWEEPRLPPSQQVSIGVPNFSRASDEESRCDGGRDGFFDLELYSIERECQQLGTRLH